MPPKPRRRWLQTFSGTKLINKLLGETRTKAVRALPLNADGCVDGDPAPRPLSGRNRYGSSHVAQKTSVEQGGFDRRERRSQPSHILEFFVSWTGFFDVRYRYGSDIDSGKAPAMARSGAGLSASKYFSVNAWCRFRWMLALMRRGSIF